MQAGLRQQITKWFHNHTHAIKKGLGETKRRKKDNEGAGTSEPGTSQPEDDEATLRAHCVVIERECKKRDGAKDYGKIFRLLTATRNYCRKWMLTMNATTRVITSLNSYPCLKKAIMVCEMHK